jgi:putative ABC transport system permease protein
MSGFQSGGMRYALRTLVRNPGLTSLITLTLALGIGANTAIFSVVNAVLLRPLPLREPDRLATIVMSNAKFNETGAQPGFSLYLAWKRNTRLFESVGAAAPGVSEIELGRATQQARFWRVSASLLPTLGVSPALGRNFREEEDQPGAAKVAIISDSLWRSAFAADPRVLGSTLRLEATPYVIVGVLPPGFHSNGRPADVYAPIALGPNTRDWLAVDVYARLNPSVSIEQANSEMDAIANAAKPDGPFEWRPRVWNLHAFQVRELRFSLLVLLAAVGLVLLIACANVASLLLARAETRSDEIAIRQALGAGPGRLIRQLLGESVLLGVLGGAAAIAVGWLCIRLLPYIQHERLPGLLEQTRIDPAVLAFTLGMSALTGVIFGAAPAIAILRGNRFVATKARRHNRAFRILIAGETALAVVLAIGATLLIRTFFYLRDVAPGFRVDGLVIATVNSERGRFSTREQCVSYYGQILEAVRRIPGVRSATLASNIPQMGELSSLSWPIEGHHFTRVQDYPILWHRAVDASYLRTMEIPLRRGRFFTERDSAASQKVVVVNEAFVRRFWPGQDGIGKHMGGGSDGLYEVIGVTADVRSQDSTKDPAVEILLHHPQSPTARVTLAVRTDSGVYHDPRAIEPALRNAIAAVDPRQPVTSVAEMRRLISDRVAPKRLSAQIIAVFASLAIVLAATGIFGVLSFTVARRTREIGIRLAIGAEREQVLRMIVLQSLAISGVGILIGIVAALTLTRASRTLFYGVSAADPQTFLAAAAGAVAVSIGAALIPAWRATRIDPAAALRDE